MGWIMRLMGVEHVAELRGERVAFVSSARRGSWMLHSDGVQALKDAGLYKSALDGDRVKVDGILGWSTWE